MITTLTCNACLNPIPLNGTRVVCRVCANYDLCSNCHTLGRSSDSHEVQHETLVLYPPTGISRDYHVPPAPPPPLPPRSNDGGETSPRSRPRPALLPTRTAAAASKLLSTNNTPTKRLKELSDAVFAHINRTYPSANQNLLNPSQVSNFYELIGRPLEGNPFGRWIGVMNAFGCSLDNMDPEVAHFYDQLAIEHSLITRAVEGASRVVLNGMPVLGHRGFRQLMVCEILEDPGRAHTFFKQLVHLAIVDDTGRAFEEVPREVFPAVPNAAFAAKLAAVIEELGGRAEVLFAKLRRENEDEGRRMWALAEQEEIARTEAAATLARIEQERASFAIAQSANQQLALMRSYDSAVQ
ncbi:hypothetical protein C7212DRAFT_353677 [Tuber magnatum]|uniref:ZZ-type domain-containing protein n=1 Tax=Tuber magnatum TaxID=42249 RepID=A0A317SH26_9PEZI|nr:hypothetical protein C7212DRAFT_353677 [Tuber magnatum]